MHYHAFTIIEFILCILALVGPSLFLGWIVGRWAMLQKVRNGQLRWRTIRKPGHPNHFLN